MKTIMKCVVACTVSLLCVSSGRGDDMSTYLTPDGLLKHPIELRDAQEGFVGVTGSVLTVEPDGSWHVARFLKEPGKEEEVKQTRSGKLTREQLSKLAQELSVKRYKELPAAIGNNPKINRHIFTIRFGEDAKNMFLRGRESIEEASPPRGDQEDAWVRFSQIAHVISDFTRGETS